MSARGSSLACARWAHRTVHSTAVWNPRRLRHPNPTCALRESRARSPASLGWPVGDLVSGILAVHLGDEVRHLAHRHEAVDVGAEVPRALPLPLEQGVDEGQVAVQAVEHVLPGAHGLGVAQGGNLTAGVGADQVGEEAIGAHVATRRSRCLHGRWPSAALGTSVTTTA